MLVAQHHHRGFNRLLLVVFALTFASRQVSTAAVNENGNTVQTRRKEQEEQQSDDHAQSRYLQEILMGRCYERPPTGNHQDDSKCPSLMGSITGVILGSHLDQDVTVKSFEPYFDSGANFTSPRDSAVLMLDPATSLQPQHEHTFNGLISTFFVTPQMTHGGAILANLVFCGVNVRDNAGTRDDCRWSQTSLSFWQGAYSHFASRVQGHLRIFLPQPIDDTTTTTTATSSTATNITTQFKTLVLDAGIAHLNATSISGISIYSPLAPCTESKLVSQVKEALTSVGVPSNLVTCTQNIFSMFSSALSEEVNSICKGLQDPTITASSSSTTTTKTSFPASSPENQMVVGVENDDPYPAHHKRNHHYTLFFFLTVVPLAGGYILMANRMKRATAPYERVRDVPC